MFDTPGTSISEKLELTMSAENILSHQSEMNDTDLSSLKKNNQNVNDQ